MFMEIATNFHRQMQCVLFHRLYCRCPNLTGSGIIVDVDIVGPYWQCFFLTKGPTFHVTAIIGFLTGQGLGFRGYIIGFLTG